MEQKFDKHNGKRLQCYTDLENKLSSVHSESSFLCAMCISQCLLKGFFIAWDCVPIFGIGIQLNIGENHGRVPYIILSEIKQRDLTKHYNTLRINNIFNMLFR